MDGKSLKSIDQLKKLLEKLRILRRFISTYLEHEYEKDSKLLAQNDLIRGISISLDNLENTFFRWLISLKEEFLQFINNSKGLHESSIQEMNPQSEKLPPSAISKSMASEELKEYIFQSYYYSKIIEYLDCYCTKYFKRKDDKKIKEYESYIKIVLEPIIYPIYECCRNNFIETCDELSNLLKLSLSKLPKVFNFFIKEFSEYFKIPSVN